MQCILYANIYRLIQFISIRDVQHILGSSGCDVAPQTFCIQNDNGAWIADFPIHYKSRFRINHSFTRLTGKTAVTTDLG